MITIFQPLYIYIYWVPLENKMLRYLHSLKLFYCIYLLFESLQKIIQWVSLGNIWVIEESATNPNVLSFIYYAIDEWNL